jgi:transposase InsO family protein
MARHAPLTEAEKGYIRRQKETGMRLGQIAQELACSFHTVRKWWRYQRDGEQPRPQGRPAQGVLSTFPRLMREKAIELKQAHPHWGPASVKLELKRVFFTAEALPSHARLSVLFHQCCPEAVQPRNPRPTRPKTRQVYSPHQRWQMDAKEGVRVAADFVTLLEIRDLFSGLMIGAHAFVTTTPKRWRRLSLAENQQALRWAFQSWGLPLEVQTDHDGVFIVPKDPQFPSLFSLWLVGLGVLHVTSRPYRPTDQGSIERNHRTLGDFAWKDQTFEQVTDLQKTLDEHQLRYNQEFPSQAAHCDGCPPLVAFPGARSTGRPYHPAQEWDAFRLEWVDAYLAQFVWTRPVMPNGVVNLGNHPYSVGRKFQGQRVSIQFLPATRSFRFQSPDGTEIKVVPALGLAKEDILGFIPAELALPVGFQFPLPLVGV